MPEGDTIHRAARRLSETLVGREIVSIEAPQPRHRRDLFAERLAGRAVRGVDALGKHILVRFEGDLTLYSHLGMSGMWAVYRRGERWRRSSRRAWLIVRTAEHEVVQFDGPVLELMTEGRTRLDRRLRSLGPDILAGDFDERSFLRRLREDDPTRGVGDALLDQRNLAGIGNLWKSKACFLAGVDPWRPLALVEDEEALRILRVARPLMQASARADTRRSARAATGAITTSPADGGTWVYGRTGRPCPRCGTAVRSGRQGETARATYWCPACQR